MTRPSTPPNKSFCPTPTKVRYSSRREVRKAATEQGQRAGLKLSYYDCVCGFYHLTKLQREPNRGEPAEVIGVPHVMALNDIDFVTLVRFEMHGRLTEDECAIIRHPDIAARWATALGWLRDETEADLRRINEMTKSASTKGRRQAKIDLIALIERRQREARHLVKQANAAAASETDAQKILLRKQQRRTAGERAIESLINRHKHEFAELFAAEAELVGLELPSQDLTHWRLSLEQLQQLHPAELGSEHVPRYPNIHVVLTGNESFYEIAALGVGAVFRHLRDGDSDLAATYAVVDIVGALQRMTVRNARDAYHVLSDWVTIHGPFSLGAEVDEAKSDET